MAVRNENGVYMRVLSVAARNKAYVVRFPRFTIRNAGRGTGGAEVWTGHVPLPFVALDEPVTARYTAGVV